MTSVYRRKYEWAPFYLFILLFICVCIEKLVGKGESDLCSISKLSGIILKTIVHALTYMEKLAYVHSNLTEFKELRTGHAQ